MTVEYARLPIRSPKVQCDFRSDGSIIISQDYAIPPAWPSIPHLLAARALQHPDRWLIARRERLAGGARGNWQGVTYAEILSEARAAARWLIEHGYGPEKSIAVLSGSSSQHLVLMYAAQMARAMYMPVSTNFSVGNGPFSRLEHVLNVTKPSLVFVEDASSVQHALSFIRDRVEHIVVLNNPEPGHIAYADLIARAGDADVDSSIAAITPETLAKVIFTSGSTGKPKAVMITQRVMTAVIQEHDALYIRNDEEEPSAQVLGWMAWSHTGPNNIVLTDVLNDGATFYIDDGAPVEGRFDETIRNLREIHPAEYGSAPIFYSHLVTAMDHDHVLRDAFFSRLKCLSYSTAGLSQDVFERLQGHAIAATGKKIPTISKYGTTETQGLTLTSWPVERTGAIGLPFPGMILKLAPIGDRLEIRTKGPAVTPGYYADPDATLAAFDEEGFYCTGDAAVLSDPSDPSQGISFDGRIAENFKMSSGTWVAVGNLRLDLLLAMKPDAAEVVIVGENRDRLCILLWVPGGAMPSDAQRQNIVDALRSFNAQAVGLSRKIWRVMFVDQALSGDEVTEKGTVNQRAVQRNRAAELEALYEPNLPSHVSEITSVAG
jgi:feruloyl-CoA synthase